MSAYSCRLRRRLPKQDFKRLFEILVVDAMVPIPQIEMPSRVVPASHLEGYHSPLANECAPRRWRTSLRRTRHHRRWSILVLHVGDKFGDAIRVPFLILPAHHMRAAS